MVDHIADESNHQRIFPQTQLKPTWSSIKKVPDTKRRNYTSVRFFKAIMSGGNVRNLFLCSNKDFKLCKLAILEGRLSSLLSHNTKDCNCFNCAKVEGTSNRWLPPNDKICKLKIKVVLKNRRGKKSSFLLNQFVNISGNVDHLITAHIQILQIDKLQYLFWERVKSVTA